MTKNKEQIKERIEYLKEEIDKHDKLYDLESPIITDTKYDKLYAELLQLEKENPEFFDENSPTQKITSVVIDGLQKVTHETPMLSQDKVHNAEDLKKFCSQADISKGIIVQHKLDGLTIVERYLQTLFNKAITRGNGYIGEDVTHTIRNAKGVPLVVNTNQLEVRSEALIFKDDFDRINVDGKYKTARNLVSGSVRTLDSLISKERNVQVITYDLISSNNEFELDTEQLEFLKKQGFNVVPYEVFYDIDKLIEYCTTFNEKVRPNLPYVIDGLVLKYNDLSIREELGYTSKYPRWGCAFKFESQDATTKLIEVDWSVGKTGKLTPNAQLEAVEIDGVTIKSASLANYDNIVTRDVQINDTVFVQRANDVIPQVIGSIKELRTGNEIPIKEPTSCPKCGGAIEKEGAHYYCINEGCPAQLDRQIKHFVSRDALNIDTLGDKAVEIFLEKGLISSIKDIYYLKYKEQQLLSLEKFGDKKVEKLIQNIEKSKEVPLSKLLFALSIRNIGESGAKDLAKKYVTMDNILEKAKNKESFIAELLTMPDFGNVCANSFANFMTAKKNIELMETLKTLGFTMKEDVKDISESVFTGKTVVATGTLNNYGRKEIKDKLESLGAKVSGSVSKKTDYVLVGSDAGSKYDKALELGVKTITEEEFEEMIK